MAKKVRTQTKSSSRDDSFAAFFDDWRRWLTGAFLGALLAWLAYQVAPPLFRATATVVIDHNLEQAWVYYPDRQLFQFLQRETERLEELAWSDAVMQEIAEPGGLEVIALRNGVLELSHPSDGGWHFHAIDQDPAVAADLAGRWANAFVDAVRSSVSASPELERARIALQDALDEQSVDESKVAELLEEINFLGEHTKGISPYVELAVSQSADLPLERQIRLASYLLAGSLIGAVAFPAYRLFMENS
ncbi:MAG: hypothetical protein ACRDFQ_03345 [Anaerolineales bacterium]